ncbi:MAG TPA: hypothetical protein VFT82_04335 [Candidatus Paceibacterota bacterium]|nr:hypothetical protein [Candidatus Paceibacterota bacterium]
MAKPMVHAKSSAEHFGGKPKDYLDIHQLMDSSREAFPDMRHRALTHNSWFITKIIPLIFGETRVNSAGTRYSTRAVAEFHVLEDFKGKYIPSAQDFLAEIEFKDWMDNGKGEPPPSHRKLGRYTGNLPKAVLDALQKTGTQVEGIKLVPVKFRPSEPFAGPGCRNGPPGMLD